MTAPQKLAHVVFRTNQLPTMIDWYCTVLDADVTFANDALAFLTYDDEHHRIALIATEQFAPRPPSPAVGFYHVAFTYRDLHELLETYDHLQAHDICPWRTINHGPTMSFYYSDPDGNDVELQVDRFADNAEVNDWLRRSDTFAANPIGVLVDPADLRHRLASGESADLVMRRPDEPALDV